MKKIIYIICAITLLIANSVYADIKIESADAKGSVLRDKPDYNIYTAKIKSIDYIYKGEGGRYEGSIFVTLSGVYTDSKATIYFTKDDRAFGNTLTSALGKTMQIYFTNKYSADIDQLHVE